MRIVVIGGGISGVSAAKVALKMGHEVTIVEKEEKLGGLMSRIANCRVGFKTFFDDIKDEHRLKLLMGNTVVACEKRQGNFLLRLQNGETLEAESIIVAAGLSVYEPEIKGRRILSSLEYDRLIDQANETIPDDFRRIAFILCVGSRKKDYPLCSSVCCSYTLRQIKWTLMRAQPEITVFYNDLRFFGQEFFLENALRGSSVRFVRTNSRNLEEQEESVRVRYFSGGKTLQENFNYVVLTNGLRPNQELFRLSKVLGFSLNEYGFVKEESPLKTSVDGIFACGGSLEPMNIKDSILTGYAAGFLASNPDQQVFSKEKIFHIEKVQDIYLGNSDSTYVLYLGSEDTYSKMFYEYVSFQFLELALTLIKKGKHVCIITRNLVVPSYGELIYEDVRRKGVVFIHLEEDERVVFDEKKIRIDGRRLLEIPADRVILMDEVTKPLRDHEILAFYRSEPQLRWSPTKWQNDRFHVGFARYPREKRWEIREYYAACAEILLESEIKKVPQVFEERCSGCGSCRNSCVSGAVQIFRKEISLPLFGPYFQTSEPIARIDPNLCLGCGVCASTCPSHAIGFDLMKTSKDTQAVQGSQ